MFQFNLDLATGNVTFYRRLIRMCDLVIADIQAGPALSTST